MWKLLTEFTHYLLFSLKSQQKPNVLFIQNAFSAKINKKNRYLAETTSSRDDIVIQ